MKVVVVGVVLLLLLLLLRSDGINNSSNARSTLTLKELVDYFGDITHIRETVEE